MAGYIGSKAVNLSTTGADINGNANVDGTLDVTGAATLATAYILGGGIENTAIGSVVPAAGTFTALTSNGIDDNAAATAVTIDASGNVGIGASSPSTFGGTLNVVGAALGGETTLVLSNSNTSQFVRLGINNNEAQIAYDNADELVFGQAASSTDAGIATERMRIDSSGNVLVGKTSDDATVAGMALRGNGVGVFTRASSEALYANRLTTDGEVIKFAKDTVTVGSISSSNGNSIIINGANTRVYFSSHPTATIDNNYDLGGITIRWDDIYATNATIQTSDRNEKEAIASLTPTEMLVAARLSSSFKNFKWKDAVAEKGMEAARMHSGIIAQDVQDAFTAEGLDASDYAMFISGTWWEAQTDVPAVEAVAEVVDEEGNVVTEAVEAKEAYTRTDTYHTLEEAPEGATERTRLGIRYPELLAFVAAYNDQRFLAIEARLTALEATP